MPGAAVFRCPGIVDGDERFQGEKIRRAPRGKNVLGLGEAKCTGACGGSAGVRRCWVVLGAG